MQKLNDFRHISDMNNTKVSARLTWGTQGKDDTAKMSEVSQWLRHWGKAESATPKHAFWNVDDLKLVIF